MTQRTTGRLLPLTRPPRPLLGLLPGLLLAAACAPPPQAPSPVLQARLDSVSQVEDVILGHGALPDQEAMHPGVRLIGPPGRMVDGRVVEGDAWHTGVGRIVRDTVTGPERAADWLQARRVLQGSAAPFGLRTTDVFLCEDAALQYGTFLTRGAGRQGRPVTNRFAARWIEEAPDEWRLELLWLAPPSGDARPGRLAADCRSAATLRSAAAYLDRRVGVQFLGGLVVTAATDDVSDAFTAAGWDRGLQSRNSVLSLSLESFYRLTGSWEVATIATYQPSSTVSGRPPSDDHLMRLDRAGLTLAVLGVYQFDRFRIGAGPAYVASWWNWTGETFDPGPGVTALPPQSNRSGAPGVVAQTAFVQPLGARIYAHITGRYGHFPGVTAPGYQALEPFDVTVSGPTLGLGLGWWW